MTIAIGILSGTDVIIAADSQETVTGYWKRDESKVYWSSGPNGHLILAGAGDAGYVDALNEQLTEAFHRPRTDQTIKGSRSVLEDELDLFYARHVIPFGEGANLDVEFVIGVASGSEMPALFKSQRTVLTACAFYGAVGIGAGYALPLLSRLCPMMPAPGNELSAPVALATYVVSRVKQSVAECGHYTDVVWAGLDIDPPHAGDRSGWLERSTTAELDKLFRHYDEEIEPGIAGFFVGARLPLALHKFKDLTSSRARVLAVTSLAVTSTTRGSSGFVSPSSGSATSQPVEQVQLAPKDDPKVPPALPE